MSKEVGAIAVIKGYKNLKGDDCNIWIDRKTNLGNPFDMQANETKRDDVCEAFRHYLWEVVRSNKKDRDKVLDPSTIASQFNVAISPMWKRPTITQIVSELGEIKNKVKSGRNINLICHCAPKKCHGLSIANCVLWRIRQEEEVGVFLEKYNPEKFDMEKVGFEMLGSNGKTKTFHIGEGDGLDDSLWPSPLWRYGLSTQEQNRKIDAEIKDYLGVCAKNPPLLTNYLYLPCLMRISTASNSGLVKLIYINDLEHAEMIRGWIEWMRNSLFRVCSRR